MLAGARIEVLRAVYLNVTTPTDKSSRTGWWPDPLVPGLEPAELEPGTNEAYWVRVYVSPDAVPGTYRGTVRAEAEGWRRELPLELTVYDFALPNRMTCQTAFGFSPGEVFRYHGLKDEQSKRAVLAKYWENLSAHHISRTTRRHSTRLK